MAISRRQLIQTAGVAAGALGLAAGTKGATSPAFAQAAGGDSLERIAKSGQMRVVYVVWPPITVKDPKTQELSGHFIDAIRFIGGEMKVKPVFVEAAWGTFVATLQAGQADLSVAATYATIQRAQSVDFSAPVIYLGWNALVAKKLAKAYKSPLDLDRKGIRIVGIDGEAETQWVQRTFKNASLHTLAAGTEYANVALEITAGRADVYFGDDYVIRKLAREHSDRLAEMFPGKPFRMNAVAWAVRKGDQSLLNFINIALGQIRDQGLDVEWEKKYGADWLHAVPNFVSTNRL